VAALLVGWALVSARVGRFGVTAPLAFVAGGFVLGGLDVVEVTATSSSARLVAESALVLLVFSDASRVEFRTIRTEGGLWVRLLGLGVPLALGAAMLAAFVSFPDIGVWPALLLAACLTPTDAGLAADVISDPAMPPRVARALNVESGMNDGLVAPIVTLAIAGVAEVETGSSRFLLEAVEELAKGAGVGIAVGVLGAMLVLASARRRWLAEEAGSIAVLGVAASAYVTALAIDGNGFVAAFLAGLAFGRTRRRLDEEAFAFTEQAGQVLGMVVWFLLGAALLRPAFEIADWRMVLCAVLLLTVARMVPVALASLGSGLDRVTVLFMGWFGPRGLASLVFGLLALDELGRPAAPLMSVIAITVLASVVLHGLTAHPLIARYRAHLERLDRDHPTLAPAQPPSVGRRVLGRGDVAS
jgi:NhaP-type Na+/H+ or K+/H+ antiporter